MTKYLHAPGEIGVECGAEFFFPSEVAVTFDQKATCPACLYVLAERAAGSPPRRILVTGSRTWDNRYFIRRQILFFTFGVADATIVHGHCPRGADRIADEIATELGMTVERHPADWKTHGRRAGFIRNAQMVDTAPDLCLAFIRNNSRGASQCAELAEKRGIPTHCYRENDVA